MAPFVAGGGGIKMAPNQHKHICFIQFILVLTGVHLFFLIQIAHPELQS
jgi:hypothetical protein